MSSSLPWLGRLESNQNKLDYTWVLWEALETLKTTLAELKESQKILLEAYLLAIKDEEKQHDRLVRYYKGNKIVKPFEDVVLNLCKGISSEYLVEDQCWCLRLGFQDHQGSRDIGL